MSDIYSAAATTVPLNMRAELNVEGVNIIPRPVDQGSSSEGVESQKPTHKMQTIPNLHSLITCATIKHFI